MKFVCHNCKAKYTISDEKVRNKRLKIRCKKCSAVIEVVDPLALERKTRPPGSAAGLPADAPAASATTDPTAAPTDGPTAAPIPSPPRPRIASPLEQKFAGSFGGAESPSAGGAPGLLQNLKHSAQTMEQDDAAPAIWFVGIDNAPVGPVNARTIHRYRSEGRVGPESVVWKEGMEDWGTLAQTEDLQRILMRLDAESAPSPTADAANRDEGPEGPRLNLFQPSPEAQDNPLRGAQMGVLDAQRPEQPEVDSTAPDAPAATPSVPEAQGAPAEQTFFSAAETEHDDLSIPPPRGRHRHHHHLVLWISLAFFATAATTLGFVLFGGDDESTTSPKVQIEERVVEKVVYRDRLVEVTKEANEGGAGGAGKKGSSNGKGAKNRKTTPKKKTEEERTRELMEQMGLAVPESRSGIGTADSTGQSGRNSGSGSAGLSADQMKRVVNTNKSAMKSCYERSLKKGEAPLERDVRVNFKVTVGASGTVTKVSLSGEGAQLSNLSSCLTHSVKRWVFPTSGGQSSLEFPFVFTPTG